MDSGNTSTRTACNTTKNPEPTRSFRFLFILNYMMNTLVRRIYKMSHTTDLNPPNKNPSKNTLCENNSPKEANQNSNTDFLNGITDTEAALTKTLDSFALFRTHLQSPDDETAKPLLFDFEDTKDSFTQEKMDKVFLFLEAMDSSPDSVDTTKTPYDPDSPSNSDQESISSSGCQEDIIFSDSDRLQEDVKKKRSEISRLRDELHAQEKQIKSLEKEKKTILGELGEMKFNQQRKEREETSSGIFHQIFSSPLPNFKAEKFSASQGSGNDNNSFGYPNDDQTTFGKSNGVNCDSSTFNSFPNDPRQTQKKISTSLSGEIQVSAVPNIVNINPEKRATGGDGIKSESEEEKILNTDQATTLKDERDLSSQEKGTTENSTSCVHQREREKVNGNESEARRNTDPLTSTSRDETDDQNSVRQSNEVVSFPVQQDDANGKEFISLASKPPISVATSMYNNYKRLLLTLAQSLLSSEVVELKNWAKEKFAIENTQNASDVLFQLDEKGAINAEDLNQLCGFFKSIVRYDLEHIIEAFLLGDYDLFRLIPRKKKASRVRNSQLGRISWNDHSSASSSRRSSVSSTASGETVRNPTTSGKPQNNNESPSSGAHQIQEAASSSFSVLPNPSNPGKLFSRTPNENQSTARVQQDLTPTRTGLPTPNINKMVVPNGSTVLEERRTMAANVSTRTSRVTKNTLFTSSNGLKHSKFQRPSIVSNSRAPSNSGNLEVFNVQDDNWLCSHYKRHCFVKFECCDKFWPCHRCHNNQSSCGRKKLKSRDTKMLKCVYCNKEQQFGQFCCDCGAKFSNYFCGLCKHLTGHDDFPYHCEKCGICRIHGDRSFHCDVCGVCLDVQLQGNHKCREGSAHDECCICLEDAFTGCQILPCSHKVHKECATQMIRSGITRCPICRESFAHKLERRPTTTSKKHSGK